MFLIANRSKNSTRKAVKETQMTGYTDSCKVTRMLSKIY